MMTQIKIVKIGAALVFLWELMTVASNSYAQDKFQKNISSEANAALEKVLVIRRAGQFDEAISGLQDIIKANPNYYRATYNLGLAYVDAGRMEEAYKVLEKAEKIRAENEISDPTLDNSIGWAYLVGNKYALAEKYFIKAEKNNSNLPKTSKARLYNNLGQLKIYQKDYNKANEYLLKAVDNGSNQAKISIEQLRVIPKEKAE